MTTLSPRSSSTEYPAAELPGREDTNALGFLSLFWRHRLLLLGCTAGATALGLVVGASVEPKYTASALVMLDPRPAQVLEVKAVVGEMAADAATIETQIEVLNSRRLATEVVSDLGLVGDPELGGGDAASSDSWIADAAASLRGAVGHAWSSAPSFAAERGAASPRTGSETPAGPAAAPLEQTLEAFQERLRIAQQGDSYVIKVSFTSEDPKKAADVANRVADRFIAYQLESKRSATRTASDWLGRRLAELGQDLERSEQAAQSFRAENDLIVANGVDVSDRELAEVAQAAVTARADAAAKAARAELIKRLREEKGKLDAMPEVINSPLILALRTQESDLLRQEAELRATFGARHPRMQLISREKAMVAEKIQREIERISDNLQVEAEAAIVRRATLERDVERIKAAIAGKRQAEVRLGELEREAGAIRQFHQQVLQRYKETREQEEIIEPDAKVLSAAVPPPQPATPGPVFFGAIGFTSSLLLTSLLVLLRDLADTSLRSAGEVTRQLGLARVGLVPTVRTGGRRQRPHQWLLSRPRSAYASALQSVLRSLRTGSATPQLLLVTSSVPQEGKTTLTVSLAASAAQTGKKVLLVDADFRHPSVRREFDLPLQPGLVEYVLGEVDLDGAVVHDQEAGIDVLGMGRLAANPIAVAEDEAFARRLLALKERYDLVVVDSAPVLGIPETQPLAALADQVLFVVRWGTTTRNTAKHAMRELAAAEARVGAAVLTRVALKRHARLGYGDAALSYTKYSRYYTG